MEAAGPRGLRVAALDHTLFAPRDLHGAIESNRARPRLGYYAMPLLGQTEADARVIGWVDVSRLDDGVLSVAAGYATERPVGGVWRSAFNAVVTRQ